MMMWCTWKYNNIEAYVFIITEVFSTKEYIHMYIDKGTFLFNSDNCLIWTQFDCWSPSIVDIWWLSMTQLTMTLDDSWWLFMTLDDYWWLLMTLGDSWWPLMTLDDSFEVCVPDGQRDNTSWYVAIVTEKSPKTSPLSISTWLSMSSQLLISNQSSISILLLISSWWLIVH